MPAMRRHAVRLAAVLLAVGPMQAQCGGFLGQITQSVSQAVEQVKAKVDDLPLKDATPEKLAQAIDMEAIKDTVNRTVTEAVASAEKHVAEPMQDLGKQAPNVTQVLDATAAERTQISDALQAAGDALGQGAGAVANATAGSVQAAAAPAASAAPGLTKDISDKPEVPDLGKALKLEDVAAALAGAAPEVTRALNRTGLEIAKAIEAESPKMASSVNSTSVRVAEMFGATQAPPLGSELDGVHGADLESEGAQGAGGATWWLAAALVVPLLGGVVMYQKYQCQGGRGGRLLSEGDSFHGQEMASTGRLRAPAREPLFQQF